MCEGTDADKGVLAQKTELPGIYPNFLLLLLIKMMIIIVETEKPGYHMNGIQTNLNWTSLDFWHEEVSSTS